MAINTEGRTFVERYGVIGGESSDHVLFSPFSPPRAEAGVAWKELGDRFGWQVTRDNYADIIAAAAETVVALKASRRIDDKRRTPEQEAEIQKRWQERVERERQEAEQRKIEQARLDAENAAKVASEAKVGVQVAYNAHHNGIEIRFPGKPAEAIRDQLKRMGFRWSKFQGVWYTRYNPESWTNTHRAMGLEVPPQPTQTAVSMANAMGITTVAVTV